MEYGKAPNMVPGKQAMGQKKYTSKGYGGGKTECELIGAKKVKGK